MVDATMEEQQEGTLAVLNVAAGDLKITFDTTDEAEVKKAKSMVRQMIKDGYAVMVKDGDEYVRVKKFDEDTGEYVIGDKDKKERRIPAKKAKAVGVAPRAGG